MSSDNTFQDVTKSVDQLCQQLSISNIAIPRIDSYKDVYEFINELEMVTATLPDENRNKLLIKAFPPGRLRAWFDDELKPLIEAHSTWATIKPKIITRFAFAEDKDRHFRRLQELKFNPSGQQSLYDYVEDLNYTITKAFSNTLDEDTRIRFIKSNLPSSIKPNLTLQENYNNPPNFKTFMKAMRHYDIARQGFIGRPSSPMSNAEKISKSQLVSVITKLIDDVKSEAEATRNVVAALQKSVPSRPNRNNSPSPSHLRSRSPYREQEYHDKGNRSHSPYSRDYQKDQGTVKDNFHRSNNYHQDSRVHTNNGRDSRSTSQVNFGTNQPSSPAIYRKDTRFQSPVRERRNESQLSQSSPHKYKNQAFGDEYYYQRFGKPPGACPNCGYNHWARHCHIHLKE